MPIWRHFLSLQAWHWFLWAWGYSCTTGRSATSLLETAKPDLVYDTLAAAGLAPAYWSMYSILYCMHYVYIGGMVGYGRPVYEAPPDAPLEEAAAAVTGQDPWTHGGVYTIPYHTIPYHTIPYQGTYSLLYSN